MSFIDNERPESLYYNDESLIDVEDGSSSNSPYCFDDELEQAHAEEHDTGWRSEDENDTCGQESFQNMDKYNNSQSPTTPNTPLHRYPIHAGEGDIGAAALPKPGLVEKQHSQTTSMIPPSEYAVMWTSERQRTLPTCCESRTQRLRCIGGTMSAAGVFTLGFMLVLLGNMWYEKYNPSKDASPDIPQWQIVEVVTHDLDETVSPEEPLVTDQPIGDRITDATHTPTWAPRTVPQLYTLHETLGDHVQLELQLGGSTKTVYSTIESIDSFLCTKANDLLLHLPGITTVSSSAATVSTIALQLDLIEDVSIVVCDDDEIEMVYHHVFLNSVNNTEVSWTTVMDFTDAVNEMVEKYYDNPLLGSTITKPGVVMLLANIDDEIRFFTWYSNNVFAREPEIGDDCPDNHDVTWLPAQPSFPQITLWQVDDSSDRVYACGANGTTVTAIGRLIVNVLGSSNSTIEDSDKMLEINYTETETGTNSTER